MKKIAVVGFGFYHEDLLHQSKRLKESIGQVNCSAEELSKHISKASEELREFTRVSFSRLPKPKSKYHK